MGHKPPTLDQEFSIQQKIPMGKLAFFFFKIDMFAILGMMIATIYLL
jgi:hypothetical protein